MFLVFFAISVSGCSEVTNLDPYEGIPDSQFKGVAPVYADGTTLGNLTESYIRNTESLKTVNGRIKTLCVARQIADCGP